MLKNMENRFWGGKEGNLFTSAVLQTDREKYKEMSFPQQLLRTFGPGLPPTVSKSCIFFIHHDNIETLLSQL